MEKKDSVFDEVFLGVLLIGITLFFCVISYFAGIEYAEYEDLVEDVEDLECHRIKEEYESLKKTIEVYGIEEN